MTDHLGIKLDLDCQTKALGKRQQFGKPFTLRDPQTLQNLDITAIAILLPDTGAVNHLDKRRRAAIHDRRFRSVDLDENIVDLQRIKRRHQMLDRRDRP